MILVTESGWLLTANWREPTVARSTVYKSVRAVPQSLPVGFLTEHDVKLRTKKSPNPKVLLGISNVVGVTRWKSSMCNDCNKLPIARKGCRSSSPQGKPSQLFDFKKKFQYNKYMKMLRYSNGEETGLSIQLAGFESLTKYHTPSDVPRYLQQ